MERVPDAVKVQVKNRASGCCEYCKSMSKYSPQPFVMEHIVPIAKGGGSTLNNLAYSCGGCNGHKYQKMEGIDPITGLNAPLFNPRVDSWESHFSWGAKYELIIGTSPTGRATVETLHMNRVELINLRRVMRSIGEHPPVHR